MNSYLSVDLNSLNMVSVWTCDLSLIIDKQQDSCEWPRCRTDLFLHSKPVLMISVRG